MLKTIGVLGCVLLSTTSFGQDNYTTLVTAPITICRIIPLTDSSHHIISVYQVRGLPSSLWDQYTNDPRIARYDLADNSLVNVGYTRCVFEYCTAYTEGTQCAGVDWIDYAPYNGRGLAATWTSDCDGFGYYTISSNNCIVEHVYYQLQGGDYVSDPFVQQDYFLHPTDTTAIYSFYHLKGLAVSHFTGCPTSWNWQLLKAVSRPTTLSFFPNNSNIMFLTADDTLWRSVDSGYTWNISANAWINQLAWYPQRNLLYGVSDSASTKGLYRSNDSGKSFVQLDTLRLHAVCVDTVTGAVYAGTDGALLRSDDSGKTFYYYNNTFSNNAVITTAANVYGYLICAAQNDGLYKILACAVAPVLVAPKNDTVWIPQPLTMQWNLLSDATSYHIQLATDSLFTNIVIDDSGLVTATFALPNTLIPDTKYFWRVTSRLKSPATAVWSQTWQFITRPLFPEQVAIIEPANDTILQKTRVDFLWHDAMNETQAYWFEIADNDSFAQSLIDSTLGTTATALYEPLVPQTYWWRVRGKNISGWGPFSATYHFTMLSKTDVDASVPSDNSMLIQNYPNPFSTTTIIRSLTSSRITSLKIFDALSREVADLHDNISSESTSIMFDATQLPAGMYVCRMQCGEQVFRKMMMVVR